MSTLLANIITAVGGGGTNVKIGNDATYVSEGTAVTQNTVQGLAKAFVFGSNAASVADSLNVSGGTDNATGDYTYAYTNNMRAANVYASPFTGSENNDTYVYTRSGDAASVRVDTLTNDGSNVDRAHSGTVHGDLA